MSWIKRLGGRLPDFEDVIRRFPVAVLVMAVATIWLIFEIHVDDFKSGREYIFGGFVLAGYCAVIGRLIGEAREWPPIKSALISVALSLPAFLLGAFGETLHFVVPLAIGGTILFLGSAASWRLVRDDAAVWNFTQKLWTGAIFAAVGSIIFAAGMFIISEAVKALFGINLEDLTIKTLLPIGLLFLAPVYWMGTLPRYGEAEDVAELSFEARALSFLGTWMLAPLVTIYALIILAYGAKVLAQWELPKGEIAQLVSPFLGVGMLVWLMLEPKVLKEGAFVRFYRAAWHWIMLPVAILLGVAVFVRIREYGFTPIRFFLMTIVIWALIQSLWFIARPKLKRDIRIPTLVASVLLVIGAFASEPMSANSQYQRADAAKSKLSDFSPDAVKDNPEEAKTFLGAMSYLIRNDHEKLFDRLLPGQKFPDNPYGDDFRNLVQSLGLDDIEDDVFGGYARYSVRSEIPINVPEESRLFVSPDIYLGSSTSVDKPRGIVSSQDGSRVKLSIGDEIYALDFEEIFSNIEFVGEYDDTVDTIVSEISISSDNGTPAKLNILNGHINYSRGNWEGGTLTFAVLLEN